MPVVIGGDNLPLPVGIGLTDLPNIGGASGPPGPLGSGITAKDNRGSSCVQSYHMIDLNTLITVNQNGNFDLVNG